MSYPQDAELIIACQAAQGVIAIVEGHAQHEDPYFYSQWFADRAREISFIPQNGCEQVKQAVADLRKKLPHHAIYGLVDRDFVEDAIIENQYKQLPFDGVFYTNYYTLENYLLEPSGWHLVIHLLHRGNPPSDWQTLQQVHDRISQCYRRMFAVAAHNYVLRMEHSRLYIDRKYFDHPDQTRDLSQVEQALTEWGQRRSAPQDLGRLFRERLEWFENLPPAEWPCWVTGKELLNRLWLHTLTQSLHASPEHLKTFYINQMRFNPPPDLVRLVEHLVSIRR